MIFQSILPANAASVLPLWLLCNSMLLRVGQRQQFREHPVKEPAVRVMPIMSCSRYDFEMVFVDDGLSDRAALILSELAHDNDYVRLNKLSRNFGK